MMHGAAIHVAGMCMSRMPCEWVDAGNGTMLVSSRIRQMIWWNESRICGRNDAGSSRNGE